MVKQCKLFKVQSISVIFFVSKFGTFDSLLRAVFNSVPSTSLLHVTHIFLAQDLAQCGGHVPTSKTIPPQIRSQI